MNLTTTLSALITSNHILHQQSILDAFGHISVRHPSNGFTFLLSRDLAPALVASPDDIIEYGVEDGEALRSDAPQGYRERYIHAAVMRRFPDVKAVVHSHAPDVVPYTVNGVPLWPVTEATFGSFVESKYPTFGIPNFDTAAHNPPDSGNFLISDMRLGELLAEAMDADRKDLTVSVNTTFPVHEVILMLDHGFTAATTTLNGVVFEAWALANNAKIQTAALSAACGYYGDSNADTSRLEGLSKGQIKAGGDVEGGGLEKFAYRNIGVWRRQTQIDPLYCNVLDPKSSGCGH